MIKELFLAITLGALLGFGVTGGFFALHKDKKITDNNSNIIVTPTPVIAAAENSNQENMTESTANTATNNNENKLTIDSPENESVVSNSKVNLKGTSTPNSIIIIVTPIKSYTLDTEDDGSFDTNIELESGVNQIKIYSIDSNDNQSESLLNITYSTAKL